MKSFDAPEKEGRTLPAKGKTAHCNSTSTTGFHLADEFMNTAMDSSRADTGSSRASN